MNHFASKAATLHHCQLESANQILDLLQVPPVLPTSVACTPSTLRRASSMTPAFKHCPRDLVHSLDHLSSVPPSFPGALCYVTVELASVPVQQPVSVSIESTLCQTARKPIALMLAEECFGASSRMISSSSACHTALLNERDDMFAVRSLHDSLPSTEVHRFAHGAHWKAC